MKARNKSLGIKQKIREGRRKEENIGLAIIAVISVTIIFVSGFVVNKMLNQPSNQSVNASSDPKAAIVDQLSLTYQNETFIEVATNTLKEAGYTVDYYPSEKVTVELYRSLSTHGYKLVILRVHSTATEAQREEATKSFVVLFTSEPYSTTKYVYEQLTEQIAQVRYSQTDQNTYFGISPNFITQSMMGRFQNTTIIMMGCQGLSDTRTAKAFVEKGAKVYIGYNGSVLASYTDQATVHLLRHLFTERQTLKESVIETFNEIGSDPKYKSLLIYYPLESGSYTVQDIVGEQIMVKTRLEIKHREFPETEYQQAN